MRRSRTRCCPHPPEAARPRGGRARALAALGLLLAAACVSQGSYRELEAERDALLAEKLRLERDQERLLRSNRSLDDERAKLMDDIETLRERSQQLSGDVDKLSKSEQLLSEHLRQREQALDELSKLKGTYEGLVADLEAQVRSGQIQIEQLRDGLRLNLTQDILFASGSAEVGEKGRAILRKVADNLKGQPNLVEVQGHSDDVPISRALVQRFPTNWELAAARASHVVRVLEEAGVDPARLRATSFGEHHPIASNDTPEGRLKNRRIEIRLEPLEAPVAAAPAAPARGGAR
jgi:chemotaxis protein MotB